MKIFLMIMAFALLAVASPAFAASEVYTGTFSSTAVGGYDTVVYFTQSEAVKGSKEFSSEYKGAKWLFSSVANKEKFDADPAAYTPQYGGYCAWAVAKGKTASADPNQWAIHNGKLYLNYNADIKNKWDADKGNLISAANANWPDVLK